ncbi:SSD domain-containing protein [Aphelenchoides fujianensis]|nr:SSD domain-containing protein [Aphelenchoides fujianensis]
MEAKNEKWGFECQRNTLHGWTPYGSRSLAEWEAKDRFFDQDGHPLAQILLIESKRPGGNLLTLDALKGGSRGGRHRAASLQDPQPVERQTANLRRVLHLFLCPQRSHPGFLREFLVCSSFNQILSFLKGALQIRQNMTAEVAAEKQLHFDYPIFELFGVRINIQPSVFGVRMARNPATNRSELVAAELLSLTYKAGLRDAWTAEDVEKYEMEVFRFFNDEYKSEHLKIRVMNPTARPGGYSLLPAILLGFCILAVTSVVTVLLSAAYFQASECAQDLVGDDRSHVPVDGLHDGLGIDVLLGGVNFSSVLCITPFLILAIGIDAGDQNGPREPDDGGFGRLPPLPRAHRDGPGHSDLRTHQLPRGRLRKSRRFCIGNCVSIVVDFFFQITLFTAVLAVAGRLEMEGRRAAEGDKKEPNPAARFLSAHSEMEKKKPVYALESNQLNFHDRVESGFQSFVVKYVEVVTNTLVSSLICVCWLLFFVFSIYWLTQFRILLTFDKMVATDSPLLEINKIREQKMLPQYTTAQGVRRAAGRLQRRPPFGPLPPDGRRFRVPPGRVGARIRRSSSSATSSASNGMPREWKKRRMRTEAERAANSSALASPPSPFNADELPAFFNWPGVFVLEDLREDERKRSERSLMKRSHNWDDRGFLLHKWREVADRYPEFKLSVYNDEAIFLDLIDNMPTDAWQSALGTLVCISLVCFLFMRDSFAVAVATAIVGSVMIGMLGTLSFCGVTVGSDLPGVDNHFDWVLDSTFPLTSSTIVRRAALERLLLINMLSCLGAEHRDANVRDRLISALSSVGFPACQASLSTSLVMYLCIALCLVHSLLVLPAMFSLLERNPGDFWAIESAQPGTNHNRHAALPLCS